MWLSIIVCCSFAQKKTVLSSQKKGKEKTIYTDSTLFLWSKTHTPRWEKNMEEWQLILYSERIRQILFFLAKILQIQYCKFAAGFAFIDYGSEIIKITFKTCCHEKTKKEREAMSHVNFVMSPSPFCIASLRTGFMPITLGTLHIHLTLQKRQLLAHSCHYVNAMLMLFFPSER